MADVQARLTILYQSAQIRCFFFVVLDFPPTKTVSPPEATLFKCVRLCISRLSIFFRIKSKRDNSRDHVRANHDH